MRVAKYWRNNKLRYRLYRSVDKITAISAHKLVLNGQPTRQPEGQPKGRKPSALRRRLALEVEKV